MTGKAPGKSYRKGITLFELGEMFPDDDAAEAWFEKQRWPDGPYCLRCGTFNVQAGIKHRTMTHRCRDCDGKPMFSLKTGTPLEGSPLGYRKWAYAIYMLTTGLKGTSSMELHRAIGVTQKTAWFMMHRLREGLKVARQPFGGPVEVDEAYFGGLEKNRHKSQRRRLGRGTAGKTAVVAAKDRETGMVDAEVVAGTDAATLRPFVVERTEPGAEVYTDDHGAYRGLPGVRHRSVKHSVGEYVDGQAHVNGVESFWSMLKRGCHGTFHHVSAKHLQRYVTEFAGRHNIRDWDTIDQMATVAQGMVGRRLSYRELIAS